VTARRRLDAELVRRGLVGSRAEARTAIDGGLVTVGGRPAPKPSTLVGTDEALDVRGVARRFVSRGGEKLDAALDRFEIDVRGRDALDAGASTGGFTDVLLRRRASRVAAVDVGYGQLAWSLRSDARVTVLERTNVRDLTPTHLPFAPSIVVADLSFISLRLVLDALAAVALAEADYVLLVKPQFEAGPADVGRGGVVRDPEVWRRAIEGVADAVHASGLEPARVISSPIVGPAGNVEFLLWARGGARAAALDDERSRSLDDAGIDAAIAESAAIRSTG
jgi:23S rRNA (cytidine1920-2'-O)/16S rRNA (cytidine1409-2'-O)-methyltransferase